MTSFRDRRLDRIAAAKRAQRPTPIVLRVPFGMTIEQARAAFDNKHNPMPGHCVLIVPAKPTADEQELWADRLFEQQASLVRNAKRERVAIDVAPDEPRHRAPVWPSSPVIRPNTPRVYWKPNNGTQS